MNYGVPYMGSKNRIAADNNKETTEKIFIPI